MVSIVSYMCPLCNVNHLKDNTISGDYNSDGVLLSFCPICGRMYKISLSNNLRRLIAIRLSMQYNLDFDIAKETTKKAPKENFSNYLEKTLLVLKKDIIDAMEYLKP